MDSGTLADARVIESAAPFVCVRVDADEREDLLAPYAVRDLPCLIVLPPEGGGRLGRMDNDYTNGAEKIVATLRSAARIWEVFRYKHGTAAARVGVAPDEAAAQRKLGDAYATIQDWERAVPAYRRALALEPGSSHAQYTLEFIVYGSLELRQDAAAAAAADGYLATYPQGSRLPQVLYWRGLAAQRMKDAPTARRLWERVVAEFPGGRWAELARAALAGLPR